ncbi:hypothetical protein EV121DRAFT_298146 [Schizophyllum commune]
MTQATEVFAHVVAAVARACFFSGTQSQRVASGCTIPGKLIGTWQGSTTAVTFQGIRRRSVHRADTLGATQGDTKCHSEGCAAEILW